MTDQIAQHTPRSLIVTFYGAFGREAASARPGAASGADGKGADRDGGPAGNGAVAAPEAYGPVPVAALIRLLGAVGVDPPSVRSAVSRLKRRELLVADRTAEGAAGYGLSSDARQLLDDGDRRIYGRSAAKLRDGWVLAVFSVPEQERHKRHLLRSRLARLGFGTAAPGVWIAPAHLYEETRHTLERLELACYVDLFRGTHAGFEPTAQAAGRWWDLAAIAKLHQAFLEVHEPVLARWERRRLVPEEDAYRDYLAALDSWRRLPYADPGLPAELLPADWPGGRAAEVFARLHVRLRDAGAAYVAAGMG
ncbi:PaaX family transcriptional regulator [Streptomyces sp. H27-D2]|uniref:PaaX family transcriptional regulator n=1 Tax=Streptomyces sp. H27-D2 TaxID=3046304 RepID=UPI002DB64B79|nr:PaaX family transcriptional regulator C-terminal domain-containing protein [Streptomyces sp. H27-D2]MEC4016588.1 PaaX family transcriptional regulator C-terminal domain-containing protein [Streptomyces sp. H27-D2]